MYSKITSNNNTFIIYIYIYNLLYFRYLYNNQLTEIPQEFGNLNKLIKLYEWLYNILLL